MNLQEKEKSKINEPIALSYQWFEAEFLPKIKESFINFWESDFEIKLFSVSNFETIKKDKLSIGEIYFAKPIPINAHQKTIYRMSSEFIRTLFHSVLGSSSPQFKLSQLSELEVEIINSFLEFLNKNISQNFLPYNEIPKYALKDKEELNLTFFIRKQCKESQICTGGVKLIVTIPKNVLVPNYISKDGKNPNYIPDVFSTKVGIRAGSTKLTLSELKMLSPGDIVLMEKSNVNRMVIKSGALLQEFKVSPDPSLMIDLDEDEHDIGGAAMADKNMWDDIQIEVNAEFEKVKMTLGELKQIASGMVIDLADAFSGKISLVVENKVVARGDLVIINDRYGVKLDEIIQEKPPTPQAIPPRAPQIQKIAIPQGQIKPQAPQPAKPQPVKPQAPQPAKPQAAEASSEEDFDYSDFEDEE